MLQGVQLKVPCADRAQCSFGIIYSPTIKVKATTASLGLELIQHHINKVGTESLSLGTGLFC
jgi:hypothetical protein